MTIPSVGEQLRGWREKRRISQLDLALDADISTRHISFIETGRSRPSADMVELLARQLDIPLRARNQMLIAAGHAPRHAEHRLDDASLAEARYIIDHLLQGHEPYPALAVDRHWQMISSNNAVGLLLKEVAPELLKSPINVLRVSLHPDGLGARIRNYEEWRHHILHRLDRQIAYTMDDELTDLREELASYTAPACGRSRVDEIKPNIAIPLIIDSSVGALSFLSTTTIFGTPTDITLSEIAIEAFFPSDAETAGRLHALASQAQQ